jgi:hypothetical protein
MRLGKISAANSRPAGLARPAAETAPAEPPGRALIALTPAPPPRDPPAHYRQAPFLAQLIATKEQHPQTRERRRAEPSEAVAAYRAGTALIKWR